MRRLHSSWVSGLDRATRVASRRVASTPNVATPLLFPTGLFTREYYFWLCDRGRLHNVYDAAAFAQCPLRPPQGPTHLREARTLDFFFSGANIVATRDLLSQKREKRSQRAQRNAPDATSAVAIHAAADGEAAWRRLSARVAAVFPYASVCGVEVNLLAVQRAPVVFHSLTWPDQNDAETAAERNSAEVAGPTMRFGATRAHAFDAASLRVDSDGFLYHPLDPTLFPRLRWAGVTEGWGDPAASPRAGANASPACYGLVDATIGITLGLDYIDPESGPGGTDGGHWAIEWNGAKSSILPLTVAAW